MFGKLELIITIVCIFVLYTTRLRNVFRRQRSVQWKTEIIVIGEIYNL